jgi:hypothetical protein
MDNSTRVGNAECALYAYVQAHVQRGERYEDESLEDMLCDLLTDLRHLAAQHNKDWEKLMRRIEMHFEAEHRRSGR